MNITSGADSARIHIQLEVYDLVTEMIRANKKKVFIEIRNDPWRKEKIFTVIANGNYRVGDTDDPATLLHRYLDAL